MKNFTKSSLLAKVLVMIISIVFFTACQKGTVIPGPKGDTGPVGAAGPTGPDGKPGSQIYSGSTSPTASIGIVGDWYLDVNTSLLYGPKTASGWGAGLSLKGAAGEKGATGQTGATGAAGSQILSGTGIPAATLGSLGDYYLDKSTYKLYGPKIATGWDVPITLTGSMNVITESFELSNASWYTNKNLYYMRNDNLVDGTWVKLYMRPNKWITQDILDNGYVLVYVNEYLTGWVQLPFTYTPYKTPRGTYNYSVPSTGFVYIYFYLPDAPYDQGAVASYNLPNLTFKVVVVSGTAAAKLNDAHIDLNNYLQVTRTLGVNL